MPGARGLGVMLNWDWIDNHTIDTSTGVTP